MVEKCDCYEAERKRRKIRNGNPAKRVYKLSDLERIAGYVKKEKIPNADIFESVKKGVKDSSVDLIFDVVKTATKDTDKKRVIAALFVATNLDSELNYVALKLIALLEVLNWYSNMSAIKLIGRILTLIAFVLSLVKVIPIPQLRNALLLASALITALSELFNATEELLDDNTQAHQFILTLNDINDECIKLREERKLKATVKPIPAKYIEDHESYLDDVINLVKNYTLSL